MERFLVLAFALAACGNDHGLTDTDGGVGTYGNTGLPCDVASVLQTCLGCHGNPPSGGAPMSLVTYDDLMRVNAAGMTYLDDAIQRMQDPVRPMPPLPAAAAPTADIATLQAWETAGTPMGNCGDPLGSAPVCTSGTMWTGGNRESSLMHPGDACIACHSSGEGPRFAFAGTVYPTGHEPNDCNGATSATITVTDANGQVISRTVNSAGNFSYSGTVAFPIHAKVVTSMGERSMVNAVPSGDCNSCHTQNGAMNAPGRIVLP